MQVIYKTLNPKWNQAFEFPDNGNKLALHVKDHNAILPASNIGNCEVEYQELPPNQTADKWIPLQGVSTGEIRVLITRRFLEVEEERNGISKDLTSIKVIQISNQVWVLFFFFFWLYSIYYPFLQFIFSASIFYD